MKLNPLSLFAFAFVFVIVSCSKGGNSANNAESTNDVEEVVETLEEDNSSENIQSDKPSDKPSDNQSEKPLDATGVIEGWDYVDLGLPSSLKWATCYFGALSEGEGGDYYAWGEILPKTTFTDENSQTQGKDNNWLLSNDYIGENGNLTLEHDAARQFWGGTWRMPTLEEFQELINNATSEWEPLGSTIGLVLTSKINGKKIFCLFRNYV